MTMPSSGAAIYTLVDDRHFVGAVALVNSLRRAGHREPVHVLDCGLARWQAELLAAEATVVRGEGKGIPPPLRKVELPLARPAEVSLLVDADVIVLRRLDAVIAAAADGAVVAAEDPVRDRFHPEWAALLGLDGVSRGPYLNTGLVVVSGQRGAELLRAFAGAQTRIDFARSIWTDGDADDPFYYLDQDVFNAVVRSGANPLPVEVLPARLAPHPPFAGLVATAGDPFALRYEDGVEPLVLHHVGRKPWLHSTRETPFVHLLRELLSAGPICLDPRLVPLRLRPGLAAALDRRRASVFAALHSQRGRLGLRRRVARGLRAR
jgi:hypothetical protein